MTANRTRAGRYAGRTLNRLGMFLIVLVLGIAPTHAQTQPQDPAAMESMKRDHAELRRAMDAKDFAVTLRLLEKLCDQAVSLNCLGAGELYSEPHKIGTFLPKDQIRLDYPRAAAAFSRLCFAVGTEHYEQGCYHLLNLQEHFTLDTERRVRTEQILLDRCRASVDARRDFACVGLVARGRKGQISAETARTADRIARERCDDATKTVSRHEARQNCEILAGDLKDLVADPAVAMDRMALFIRACEQADPGTCRQVADAFRLAISYPADLPRAMKLYRYACDAGDMLSCTRLGAIYQAGDAGAVDRDMARDYYERACRRAESDETGDGNLEGCILMRHLEEGTSAGLSLYRHWEHRIAADQVACDAGRTESCVWLGDFFTEADPANPYVITFDYHQSNAAYKRGCDAGDARACAGIGRNTMLARSVDRSIEAARSYLLGACNERYVPACVFHRWLDPDVMWGDLDDRMIKRLRSDCQRRTASAAHSCQVLVEHYQRLARRSGGSKDILRYSQLGCRRGELRGCHTAAGYYFGERSIDYIQRDASTPINVARALKLDETACAQFHAPSCARLGDAYSGAMGGTKRTDPKVSGSLPAVDPARAQSYYERALLLGEEGFGSQVRHELHDILFPEPERRSRSNSQQ